MGVEVSLEQGVVGEGRGNGCRCAPVMSSEVAHLSHGPSKTLLVLCRLAVGRGEVSGIEEGKRNAEGLDDLS